MSSNVKLVQDFCRAWSRRNVDEVLSYFRDDAVYHNMPMDPLQGKPAIRALLEDFFKSAEAIEFEILNTAAAGDIVFTERVDRFDMGGKKVALPVNGIFEIKGGKIAAWRDYFDMAIWTRQTEGT